MIIIILDLTEKLSFEKDGNDVKEGYHITRLFLRREEIRTLTTDEKEYGILLCSGEGCCAT